MLMFNFSANHLIWLDAKEYDRARVSIFKDKDTNRCYKIYDYQKKFEFCADKVYCISGKLNSADKLYLILESAKEDIRYSNFKEQSSAKFKVPDQAFLGT